MTAQAFLDPSGSGLLVAASVVLIVAAVATWWLFYYRGRGIEQSTLSDGAVLLLSDGMVQQVSNGAEGLLGTCLNQPVVRVLDDFLGPQASDARDAVNRLEMTGDPVDMLVRSADGTPYELIGKPAGAMIRLVIRDARLLDNKLRDAEERILAADSALNRHDWAQQTLQGLIEEAPIIAWQRTAAGDINWSGGEIRNRTGAITAEQAVDLIVARTKLNRNPVLAGQPQKSRIEIVVNEGAETVSLHVIEMVRPDGTRIGFATDAGTAASAERTLTRFVQTMTETFAHLTVGLAIFDRNQTLALFNPALVQMWQVEPAWLARRPSLRDIIDELRATRRLPELQDFHKWRTRLIELFENTEAADYEELWHLADGSNIRVLARPHPHGSLAFIFDDVTERMRLEQRYRHSIDLRRATLDRLNEGIAVFGPNGLLQFVNQAFHEIWGTDSETVYAAMHARQLVTLCESMTRENEVWHRLHSYITGEENRRAWTARLTMGAHRILTARIAPLPDGSTMTVFSDVTETERVTLALSDRSKSLEMADTMLMAVYQQLSSKLREPLSAVLEQVESAGSTGTTGAMQPMQIEQVATSAREALEALGGIAEMTTAQLEPVQDGLPDAPLNEVARFAVNVLSLRASAEGLTLSLGPCESATKARCDGPRMRQIAFSMVSEAIVRSADGASIVIDASADPDGSQRIWATWEPDTVTWQLLDVDHIAEPMPVLRRLTENAGGIMTLSRGPDQQVLLECAFIHQPLDPEADEPETDTSFDGNVHPLNPPRRS